MQLKITAKRILLGVGLAALFILMCVGNVASHQWTPVGLSLLAWLGH
jgi:hypothetical protein